MKTIKIRTLKWWIKTLIETIGYFCALPTLVKIDYLQKDDSIIVLGFKIYFVFWISKHIIEFGETIANLIINKDNL